jgi:hypothetical protein
MGKYFHLTEKQTVYGWKLDAGRMEKALRDVLRSEHARALIIHNAGTAPVTVPRLSELTHIPADEVLRHLSVMMKQSKVSLAGHDGADPLFQMAPGAGVG